MGGRVQAHDVRRTLTLLSGMLECLCFAGVVFGFASLVFVLKDEGYFAEMCPRDQQSNDSSSVPDCSEQDERFALVFTVASFLNNFSSVINGFLFDRCGTLLTRLLGVGLHTTGTLLMALSTADSSWMLFPSLSLIAVGGILLLITNMQVGNLFPARRSTIITLYNGAFDSSSVVFLIVKLGHEGGVSLRSSFLFLTSCSVLHVLRTLLLMPRRHIPYSVPEDYSYGLRLSCGKSSSYTLEPLGDQSTEVSGKNDDQPGAPDDGEAGTFRSCLLSWFFFWHLLWLSIMQLKHYLYIGTLNSSLTRLAHNDPVLVSQYTNTFAMTQLCGVLCAPWNGLIMDRHKGKPRPPGQTEQEADLRSSCCSLLLTALQCLLFSVCASIPSLPLQNLTFILQVLNRSFLYGGNAAFLSIAFPSRHFGKLYGSVMCLSSIVSLLQYLCFTIVREHLHGDPLYVDIALIVLLLLVFVHPVYVFMHCSRIQPRSNDHKQHHSKSILAETSL